MRKFEQPTLNFTTYTEVLFNILLVFLVIITLSKIASKNESDPALAPNVMYQIVMDWPGESKTDMDLWSKDPQGRLVGFNRREGGENSLFSLAHDDLGSRNDTTSDKVVIKANQEIVSVRGTVEGEYVVNGHCYLKEPNSPAEKVTCKLVKVKPFKEFQLKEREFKVSGDEHTFFRFKVDEKGDVIDLNELPQKIVSMNKEADVGQ